MKVGIIVGTRPEIIKMAPIIRELDRLCIENYIIHTGQHYSYELDKIFFEELEIKEPKYKLEVGSGTHAIQTAKIMERMEKVFMNERPYIVLVEGDTNTVLAGALAAVKMQIKVGHVESGLRSYSRRMPEEHNRIIADHISDFLFAPTKKAAATLAKENLPKKRIFTTGNTIVDAVYQNLEIAEKKSSILNDLKLAKNNYVMVTAHREENVDDRERLSEILKGLELVARALNMPVVYPIHPRTSKRLDEFGYAKFASNIQNLKIIKPVGFMDFLILESNAALVLTDSGGVQEETCILKVPCVTLRDNTERPETVEVGSNIVATINAQKILACAKKMISQKRNWKNPFGDGTAAKKIVSILLKNLS